VQSPDHPKRILYVENGIGYGGAVICLRHLARNLDKRHFIGRIVTGRTGPEYETIPSDAEWRFIPDRHFDAVTLRNGIDGSSRLRSVPGLLGLLSQAVARTDDLGNFLPFFWGLWREIRTFRPHIIHANNEPLCNRAAVILGRLLGIPTVCHVRGPQTGSWMMSRLYRLPDHFIPVSRWIDSGIEALGVPVSKRTVIYDGIELGQLDSAGDGRDFRRRFGISEEAFAVGLVGLLIPWKGQRLFLDAARRLRSRIPGLKMLVIGGTPQDCRDYEAELRETVRNEGLEDIVIFTGHVSDMPPVYNALDIVVSASLKPEPLGTVVIEAMAMGRPLIAPNHGGGAEMNTDGETALLFEPGDVNAFSEAVLRMHASAELRRKLGAAARERALQAFDIAGHVENVESVYRSVLANGKGRGGESGGAAG
jgi:glycosyltransferase involved in cell wall biosynthesis